MKFKADSVHVFTLYPFKYELVVTRYLLQDQKKTASIGVHSIKTNHSNTRVKCKFGDYFLSKQAFIALAYYSVDDFLLWWNYFALYKILPLEQCFPQFTVLFICVVRK